MWITVHAAAAAWVEWGSKWAGGKEREVGWFYHSVATAEGDYHRKKNMGIRGSRVVSKIDKFC